MHHVSRRRGRQTEYQASIKKFLDRGKDSIKRLKALKFGLEKSSAKEVKEFYTEHSTDVFYVVYGSFTTLETTIHDKLAKGKGYSDVLCKELVELVLPVFQQVLVSLPELIHQKWQFNSICLVIRKLLHPGNHMKLRQYGMQLLVLWVQGLQENAGDACMEQFASVIPHFPPQKTPMGMPQAVPSLPGGPSGLGERYGVYNMPSSNQRVLNHWGTSQGAYPSHLHRSSSAILLGSNSSPSSREVVCSNVLVPLVPRSADQPNASEAEQLMVCLLEILTQHTRWLHWDDPAQHVRGFAHLFFLFKLFYLACLYKDFRSDAALYTPPTPPVTEVIVTRASPADTLDSLMEEGSSDTDAAEATPPVADSSSPKYKRKRGNPYRMSSVIKLEYDLSNPVYEKVKKLILLYILRWFLPSGKELLKGVARECEVYLLPSPVIHQEVGTSGVELMKHMWYTSRDNVSLLLEICRQGFTTLSKPSHMRLLVDLYWHWNQVLVKPTFMREPPLGTAPEPVKVVEEREPSAAAAAGGSEEDLLPVIHSWEQLSNYEGFKTEHVQAGMAASLCMLIAHTQQIFVLESWTDLSVQIELCRKVIRLYQDIAVSWLLDKGGWEYLLSVLLHHTWTLLTAKDNTLACALANSILKTLLICFLRVSMVMDVSPALWDQLLQVLHSLTHWKEVVMQWKLAMESMTEVLARAVYGLDLNELPLDSCDRTRPRTVSVGRQQHPASQHEIAPPKLSNFSAILDGPPANTTGQRRREQSQVTVERGKKSVDSLRGTLQRAATQDAHDSPPMVEVPIEKRHSTPSTCNKHVGPLIIMPAISEDFTSRKSSSGSRLDEISPSPTSPESVSMVTPYQPLINEDERTTQLIEGVEEEEEGQGGGAGEVIVNLNTTSPTLSQEELLHPSSNNATPPLENTSPETRHGSLPLSTGLFKHHSPDPKHRSPDPKHRSPDPKHRSPEVKRSPDVKHKKGREFMLATQPLMEDGGKSRWKKKWLPGHKRYGSDVTAQIRTADLKMLAAASSVERQESPLVSAPGLGKESSPASHSQGKGSEVSVDSTTTREHKPVLYKSASDGNLHLLLLGSHTLPKLSPPQLRDDSALHVRRISSGGSTHVSTSASTREGCVAPASSSTGAVPVAPHRPLRRSLTIDSPEPTSAGAETAAANAVHFFDPASLTVPTDTPPHAGSGGWSCKVAAVVWLRMLKVLGNVNDIQQPAAHAEAMAGLYQIWSSLKNIRANSGISLNSSATPPLPAFMPPLTLLLPWIIETCSLPPSHSRGREIAHQLLCEIMVTHWHTPPSLQHVTHFYHLLHVAMQPSADMCAVAVRHGCQLFSHGLAGSSVLLQDCVSACGALLASPNSVSPHNEALYMLGSLLYLPDLYSDYPLPVLVEEGSEEKREGLQGGELKERIVNILFLAATRESSRISRCIALYLVGTLVFSELYLERPSQRLPVGVDILLASLQFADRGVAMAAIDMMSLLSEVAPQMFKLYPSLPLKVLQAICYAIAVFLTEELEQASWVDKVLVTLLLLLRDWVMAIPLHTLVQDPAAQGAIRTVFEVLQAAAGSQQVTAKRHAISQLFTIQSPVDIELSQLVTSSNRHSHAASSEHQTLTRSSERKDVQLSAERLKNSKQQNQVDDGKIQTAARSVLTHLLNLLGHFPFGCGAAQLSSTVKEHHDSPSLLHLEEMSTEVFDSPRLQFFALDNTAVVTLLEVPTMLNGVPEGVSAGPYQSRVIVRDVTGKYTWDSTLLYGPQHIPEDTCSLTSASSLDSLEDSIGASSEGGTGPPDFVAPRIALVQPPSWRTHANSDRDVLQDLLEHVTVTSPECILDTSCSQDPFQMVPTMEKEMCQEVESSLLQLLHQQEATEQSYLHDMVSQPGMRGEKAVAPGHFPHTPAFHHCCVFLSHLGLLSWDKRNHLNILDKTSQLILELKNLDLLQAQSRATYKVAVLYVALGQEDKVSILSNSGGSQSYEEFVAGLGWEVNMETHAGYMAGMQREFASCSMPYYATSSEEVLFHVATRMASKMEQNSKVRHLGNDEVHIVWSEHWRDYRRSIFKTQFADVLIILYPLPSGLIRVQIDKKPSVPHFGPLFDGSVVDRMTVSSLVRATAINALRAQRNPLIGYRGRYEERLKYIQTITSNQLHSTFEDFCENVMHPMEMTSTQSMPAQRNSFSRSSPHKDAATPSLTNLLKSFALSSGSQYTPIVQSTPTTAATTFLKLDHTSPRRQRSSTNDERMTRSSEHRDQGRQFLRNSSVPDGLNDLTVSAPSGVSISAPTSRGILYPGPSPSPQSHNS